MNDETRNHSEHGRRDASNADSIGASRRQTGSPGSAEETRDECDARTAKKEARRIEKTNDGEAAND